MLGDPDVGANDNVGWLEIIVGDDEGTLLRDG
jgi:hypothetical protein